MISNCKRCYAFISFVKTEKGKLMPVDPKEVTIITKTGKTVKGYLPHWITCPNADDFRQTQRTVRTTPIKE